MSEKTDATPGGGAWRAEQWHEVVKGESNTLRVGQPSAAIGNPQDAGTSFVD